MLDDRTRVGAVAGVAVACVIATMLARPWLTEPEPLTERLRRACHDEVRAIAPGAEFHPNARFSRFEGQDTLYYVDVLGRPRGSGAERTFGAHCAFRIVDDSLATVTVRLNETSLDAAF